MVLSWQHNWLTILGNHLPVTDNIFSLNSPQVWDNNDISILARGDASESDMAQAVNRVKQLSGGMVVCVGNRILAEISLPIAGQISAQPMETIAGELHNIQQAAANLGCNFPDIRITLAVLSTPAIAHLRICEYGLFNLRQNEFVDLIVE